MYGMGIEATKATTPAHIIIVSAEFIPTVEYIAETIIACHRVLIRNMAVLDVLVKNY